MHVIINAKLPYAVWPQVSLKINESICKFTKYNVSYPFF